MPPSVSIGVYVQPRASKTELAGLHDGLLAKSRMQIVSGFTGRRKIVRIDGVTAEAVAGALQIADIRAAGP